MKLIDLESKNVRIIAQNNKKFEGKVREYIFPEDNEPEGVESIVVDDILSGNLVEFPESDIKSIEIIE